MDSEMDMQENDRKLWEDGLAIVRALESAGYRAYLVGGCVRDRWLGRPLNDIDIATSAKPEAVMELFGRTLPTGLQHGTVTVMEGGRPFEVTTFRRESGYSDGRRPDEVAFVDDLNEDLARRDFTFNAMAFSSEGELIDPYGGQDALRAGVVDCVGDAAERFGEDALRMVRAIRFAAELGFDILPDVWDGIVGQRSRLKQVAIERIGAEWDKMMGGSGPEQAMHYLFKSGLLACVKEPLPEAFAQAAERYRLNGSPREWDPWGASASDEATLGSLLALPALLERDRRWAALLAGLHVGAEDASALLRTLRIAGHRAARIAAAAGVFERLGGCEEAELRSVWIEAVLACGRPAAEDALAIREANGEPCEELREWLEAMPIATVAELDVKGDELAAYLGRTPGPWIAETLRKLLAETASGRLPNEKFALLSAAKQTRAPEREGRG
ncbi:CCA tRNA nucleotidyltransferase [Cohnella sp. CIP 111063]|uniref:CCA tRNA nucleotidyltransferase n=1 Tax=unclassified Cohnella TaxID=2636738 RepID=UPI000B8C4AC0|nr:MULTISPECIES: CCA tRNA nucleotidyltransferase [unclassified Cohnella]OXS61163.1 CCA tRNA nucleotidyltransferase [Cohnella sp. CIP 111063]PRX73720.1 tRNA nucleotidyltransferase (CCA-adding enzyme) [Cohnella sp. SGD-V74]